MTDRTTVLMLLALVAACATPSVVRSPAEEREAAEEHAVYSTVIQHTATAWKTKRLVVTANTIPLMKDWDDDPCPDKDARHRALCDALVAAKPIRSLPMKAIPRPFELPIQVVLLTEEQVLAAARCPPPKGRPKLDWDWTCFRSQYPDTRGVLRLSRIAFDGAYTTAVEYATFGCGPLCGSGEIHLLEKRDGRWVVVDSQCVWVS